MSFSGKELAEQVKEGWRHFIEDLEGSREEAHFVTFLAKHVRDPGVRNRLQRRVRIIFSGELPRDDAAILLLRFYMDVVEAVAKSYDDLSPTVYTALQGASNSQHVSYKTSEVLAKIYPKSS